MRSNALKRVIVAALALIAAVCMFVGCSGEKITVTLSDSSITIQTGYSHQLTATVDGSEEAVVWATSDSAVATVDDSGKVTAVGAGSATITATVKDESAACAVTVKTFTPVLTLSKETADIYVNDTETLTYTVKSHGEDFTSDATVAWSSDNETVATVSNGVITAVSAGEATITATASINGQNPTATVAVTVSKKTESKNVGEKIFDDDNKIVLTFAELGYADSYTGGNTVTAKAGDYTLTATVGDNSISIEGDEYNRVYGETNITLELNDKILTVSAFLVTDVIETKADFLAFIDVVDRCLTRGSDATDYYAQYFGYYKLGANIDMGGEVIENTLPTTLTGFYGYSYYGFNGVFDGCGHFVSDFTIGKFTGIFGNISKIATVKNVAFLNVTENVRTNEGYGTLACGLLGNLKDVRMSVTITGSGNYAGAVARRYTPYGTIENLIVEVVNENTRDCIGSLFYETRNVSSTDVNSAITNVYVVSDAGLNCVADTVSSQTVAITVAKEFTTTQPVKRFINFDDEIWNTEKEIPNLKGIEEYTVEYYSGDKEANEWTLIHTDKKYGAAGDTVTAEKKTFEGADSSVDYSDINVISGTLTEDGELILKYYYKKITYYIVNVLDDDGNDTGIIFNHYDMTGTQSTNGMEYKGTVNGQENAYYVSGTSEWYGRIQLLDPSAASSAELNGTGKNVSAIIENGGYKTLKFKLLMTHEKAVSCRVQLVGNFADGGSITSNICGGNYATGIDGEFVCIMYNGERIKGDPASENVLNKWLDVYVDVSNLRANDNNALYITSTVNYYIADVTLTSSEHPNNYDSISVLNDQGKHTGVYFRFRDNLNVAGYYSGRHDMDYAGTYNGVEDAYKLVATYDGSRWTNRFTFHQGGYNSAAGETAAQTMRNNYKTLSFKVYLDENTTNLEFYCGSNCINLKETIGDYSCVKVVDKDGAAITGTLRNGEWYTVTVDLTTVTLQPLTSGQSAVNHNVYYMYVGGTAYIANMTLSTVEFA